MLRELHVPQTDKCSPPGHAAHVRRGQGVSKGRGGFKFKLVARTFPKHDAIRRPTVITSSNSAARTSMMVVARLEGHNWSQRAHAGGAPKPWRDERSRNRHFCRQSAKTQGVRGFDTLQSAWAVGVREDGMRIPIGSVHSRCMPPWPSPLASSAPLSSTRGQNRLPSVCTVDKSPCLTCTQNPQSVA